MQQGSSSSACHVTRPEKTLHPLALRGKKLTGGQGAVAMVTEALPSNNYVALWYLGERAQMEKVDWLSWKQNLHFIKQWTLSQHSHICRTFKGATHKIKVKIKIKRLNGFFMLSRLWVRQHVFSHRTEMCSTECQPIKWLFLISQHKKKLQSDNQIKLCCSCQFCWILNEKITSEPPPGLNKHLFL